jgi:superkiller protein 3
MWKFQHYRDYAAAIKSFQVALRVEPDDQNLWVHLGEVYSKAGRHVAALKALNHAHEMKPEDWICSFLIADVKQRMGLLEEAILVLNGLRDARPAEAGILACLAQSHLDLGRSQLSDSFQIRAEESFVSAMKIALDMLNKTPGFRTMAWKIIADAAFHLSAIPALVDQDTARSTLQAISFIPPPDSVEKLVKIVPPPSLQNHESLTALQMVSVAMHASLCQISLHLLHQTTDSTAWYDLSIALQSWILKTSPNVDKSIAKDLVIEYLKQALQTDATNDIYWVALGNALFMTHAKAAQHAYIKALELNCKNSITWVSLGLLYFYHGDLELANEAMYRAQVLDPDDTSAWVGQFLIALANGHEADAQLLLQHAVGLTIPIVSKFLAK